MLEDLDLILNKDAIITTFPVKYLFSTPEQVEHHYRIHARTHVPLGDTDKYVDTIFKWIGGGNQGAFIGAVVGDYSRFMCGTAVMNAKYFLCRLSSGKKYPI
ncbi:hypothetical protein ES703_56642 [subsurface metagenome]